MDMHKRKLAAGLVLASVALLFLSEAAFSQTGTLESTAASQNQTIAPVQPANLLEQGVQLERQGQWAEALSLYQRGIKEFPSDVALRQRRAIARIHFDLERRYSDRSFLQTITATNGNTALKVYSEVLLKIQSYYVDEPKWVYLTNFGLTNLEVALKAKNFQSRNLPQATPQQIAAAIQKMRNRLDQQSVRNRADAYMVANAVAQMMKRELNVPVQSTIYEFTSGAIASLDPYSAFMSNSQYSETMSQIEGNFVGLGVELKTHADHLEIVNVIPGGPASAGHVQPGDQITAVDNQLVSEVGSERAADMLRGVEGSVVSITLARPAQTTQSIRLERRRVEIPSVDQVGIIDPKNGVAYIRLTNFQKTTARDFDNALWNLHRQGMRSLIVDVRSNPGGLLSASVEVADRFVNSGVIVSTRGRNPMEDFTHRAQMTNTWRVPLVVLIDENSASASEIFAAAISDHRRGTIVGRQSYGKGSVQGIFPLNAAGGGVRLTTAKFFSPKGNPINQVGVKPDVAVQYAARANASAGIQDEGDNGLRIAIEVANRAVTASRSSNKSTVTGR
ncbi:MAG: S41 family peptidase [Mariniblastus sp.]|nr:S41 family peptidase [Mariniblastus sp.]